MRFLYNKYMQKMTQKDAVVGAITRVMGSGFKLNETIVSSEITPKQLKKIYTIVTKGILKGKIEYGSSLEDRSVVSRYVSGLITNMLRKLPELNGGKRKQ